MHSFTREVSVARAEVRRRAERARQRFPSRTTHTPEKIVASPMSRANLARFVARALKERGAHLLRGARDGGAQPHQEKRGGRDPEGGR
jgi:hypothetical protein